ncbi:MAG: M20/M25/M40 family metallo-hydrolase [Pseudomonadota bacterium]
MNTRGNCVPTNLNAVLADVDGNLEASIGRLFDLIRFKSISTDPQYADECQKAADWLVKELNELGFEASARETKGHPMVVAHWNGAVESDRQVLFYGHYDVQPPDPLELWTTDPFEPTMVGEGDERRMVARGASDDKGQLMTFVEACRSLIAKENKLPLKISILLEGEEESGSGSLEPFLQENRDELAKSLALVCDTNMWNATTPAITTMLRGLVYQEVVVTAADRDLHSGLYGGAARNPIRVLTRMMAALHDKSGTIQVPGFYDHVADLPSELKRQWLGLGFDAVGFLNSVDLKVPAGETNRSVLEQLWSRPTCDVNGITGGYTGEGAKTVIPSKASAKVSFRLVPDQKPGEIVENFQKFMQSLTPPDCTVEFIDHGSSPALSLPHGNPFLASAAEALQDEFGRETALVGSGGSIPIVGNFKRQLGMDSLLVGFALEDDAIHSPNEKYNVSSYHKGIRSWVRILDKLANAA